MESMYLSWVCCVLTLCAPSRTRNDASHPEEERALRLASFVYGFSLVMYFVRPDFALHPVSVTFACALFTVLCSSERSATRRLQTLAAGIVLAMVTVKFVVLFPFHQWHGVPTCLWAGGLWLLLGSVLAGSAHSARSALASAYIWLYLGLSSSHGTVLLSHWTWNLSLASFEPWMCNVFWAALFGWQWVNYTRSCVVKWWDTRYNTII